MVAKHTVVCLILITMHFLNNGPDLDSCSPLLKETFYLTGLPWLNRVGIKMKFSVQSIMGKPCEPDNLAARAHPASRSDSRPGMASHGSGSSEARKNHLRIFQFSSIPALIVTDMTMTSFGVIHRF